MYSGLGVLAAYTGQLFGGWLQSAWVTGGIGALLVVLAASMFGAFELQLPASVQTRLGNAQRAAGPTGTYLSGLLVGVIAAPCIGPPVIAVLAFVGREGDPALGLATMSVMALGLGLPYLILGTFSGLLARLPQSGTWMVQVKKIFGLVLLGAGGFYLGLAVAPDWAYYAVPAVLVLGGAYLAYLALRTRPGGTAQNALRVGAAFAGAAALAGAVWFVQVLQADGVAWASYSDEVVAKAQAQSQPVVLDFTADWCIPCQELDRITFTDDQVVEAMEGVQPVKVDLTETGTPRTKRLRSKYDVAGVPTIVFLDENGEEVTDARTVGFVGPDEFLSRLGKIKSISAPKENATPKSGSVTARSQ
jgi:thiol:disulfide interchange protein DsbD